MHPSHKCMDSRVCYLHEFVESVVHHLHQSLGSLFLHIHDHVESIVHHLHVVHHLHDFHESARRMINNSNNWYKAQADAHMRDQQFSEGKQVMICIQFKRLPRGATKKSSPRRMSPHKILRKIEANAYELDIPASVSIHSVFNVKDLAPYFELYSYTDPRIEPPLEPPLPQLPFFQPQPTASLPEDLAAPPAVPPVRSLECGTSSASPTASLESVEGILAHDYMTTTDLSTLRYLVHWRSRPDLDDTWIAPAELERLAPELRLEYDRLHSSEMNAFKPGGVDGERPTHAYSRRRRT